MPWLTDLADALRAGGCQVSENDGWKGRGHDAMSGVRGVILHHTAGGGSNDWKTVQDGRPGLDGPLAHMTLERDGTFRLIAAGQCWHAGNGTHPAVGTNNGNTWLVGIEGVSRGTNNDWTQAQRDAYPRGVAAILRHYGLGADRAILHREWARPLGRKIDPEGFDGDTIRRDIAGLLADEPTPATKGFPEMLPVQLPEAGTHTGTIICPTGSVSAIVKQAWISVRAKGGATVKVWFQKSAKSDGDAPGAGAAWSETLQSAQRGVRELPDATEYLEYEITTEGPGAIVVELLAK